MTKDSAETKQLKANERIIAWEFARELVDPIVEFHGLKEYKTSAGNIFSPAAVSTFTPVDQHIDQIMRVANWILTGDQ